MWRSTQGYVLSVKPEIIDAERVISGGDHRTAPRLPFELLESKLHPPAGRPGIVARTALVDRLAAAQAPVVTVVAPPGYGKTTLLAQWAERGWPRMAWVSCDNRDNDPVVLLSALPRLSCDFCRCCPLTSRSGRSANGYTSPRIRSRHRRTRSTESSESHHAARRSPARTSSVWTLSRASDPQIPDAGCRHNEHRTPCIGSKSCHWDDAASSAVTDSNCVGLTGPGALCRGG
jgi:hypothetical protein